MSNLIKVGIIGYLVTVSALATDATFGSPGKAFEAVKPKVENVDTCKVVDYKYGIMFECNDVYVRPLIKFSGESRYRLHYLIGNQEVIPSKGVPEQSDDKFDKWHVLHHFSLEKIKTDAESLFHKFG
jgi:hypothetical protein